MGSADQTFADRICGLLLEISSGSCSITEEMIEAEPDENVAAVLAGLSMLWRDMCRQGELREEAERSLQAREARFRALFHNAKVAIWDCDLNDALRIIDAAGDDLEAHLASAGWLRRVFTVIRIRAVNRETLTRFGAKTYREFVARLGELVVPQSTEMLQAMVRSLAENRSHFEMHGVLASLHAEELHVVFGVTRGGADDATFEQAIITVADVTPIHEARQAAQELASLRTDELARVSAEVERLFYAVSHDLRAPLRGILNLAEWSAEDLANHNLAEVDNHLTLLRGRALRLETMLGDLLSYARVGRVELPIESFDVGALLAEIRDSHLALPEGFELTWTAMPTLTTQRTLLSQVLINLIANAVKHHHRGNGRILVLHRFHDEVDEFKVVDDGPGIPERDRVHVFGMFATLKPRDEVEGSGMGLAFVHKVVTARGGAIEVSDTPGGGATFTFTWPTGATDRLSRSFYPPVG
jgi:signal transduction histidine kinase